MVDASDEVLVRVENRVGLIVLNRPKAINSLTDSMVETIQATLSAWERDDDVSAVMISGAGERGLCAGGDVVAIYHSARADGEEARRFWHAEYLLNSHIGRYSKPLVALMDGMVMGGGIGIGAHANTRVVTDTSKLAMPEVGIGFIPDVGGTYLLARAPGLMRSRWVLLTTMSTTTGLQTSPPRSFATASPRRSTAMRSNRRRAPLSRSAIGLMSATPGKRWPILLPRCAGTRPQPPARRRR